MEIRNWCRCLIRILNFEFPVSLAELGQANFGVILNA